MGDVGGERGGFKRAVAAYDRRDIEAMVEISHPEAAWYQFTARVEGDDALTRVSRRFETGIFAEYVATCQRVSS